MRHPTHICPELDELKPLLGCEADISKWHSHKKELATKSIGKPLRTNHACDICDTYGHYTHHCPEIPRYRDALHAIERSYQEDPSIQSINDEPHIILYLQEEQRSPERPPAIPPPPVERCVLCNELDHFIIDCLALEMFQRCYLVHVVYHANMDIQYSCEICGENHLVFRCHYIPRFCTALYCM